MKTTRKAIHDQSFEVDIAQEFHDIKQSIAALAQEFREWRDTFNTQLTKLNLMMEQTLAQIANHEARITSLESKTDHHITKTETQKESAKFWIPIASWAFKWGFVIAAVIGSAKAIKVMGIF